MQDKGETLRQDIESNISKLNSYTGLFIGQTANECIKEAMKRPAPAPLYDTLWFEGELSIFFGDTGLGKSIKAVQIGDAISKKQKVAYLDFELSDKQFQLRYSHNDTAHIFHENFYRFEINTEHDPPDGVLMEDYVMIEIEKVVKKFGFKILIIDNLTYLTAEQEKAKDAMPLMKKLKKLKSAHDLSILAIAHTPKRDLSKPLSRNDIAGSKMLINYADSAFGLGESHRDGSLRYLKQIKVRNCELKYGSDNVMLYELRKDNAWLGFEFLSYANEDDHLRQETKKEGTDVDDSIIHLHETNPDLSTREIAKRLETNPSRVFRVIKRFTEGVTETVKQ